LSKYKSTTVWKFGYDNKDNSYFLDPGGYGDRALATPISGEALESLGWSVKSYPWGWVASKSFSSSEKAWADLDKAGKKDRLFWEAAGYGVP